MCDIITIKYTLYLVKTGKRAETTRCSANKTTVIIIVQHNNHIKTIDKQCKNWASRFRSCCRWKLHWPDDYIQNNHLL